MVTLLLCTWQKNNCNALLSPQRNSHHHRYPVIHGNNPHFLFAWGEFLHAELVALISWTHAKLFKPALSCQWCISYCELPQRFHSRGPANDWIYFLVSEANRRRQCEIRKQNPTAHIIRMHSRDGLFLRWLPEKKFATKPDGPPAGLSPTQKTGSRSVF